MSSEQQAPQTPPTPAAVPQPAQPTPPPAIAEAAPVAKPVPRAKHSEDYEFGAVLGEGSFGAVVRAIDKETRKEYAVKIIEKELVVRMKKQKYVTTERDILFMTDHPNVVKLFNTFRSESSLHYVMELCPNGELLTWLKKFKTFNTETASFYTAEIINAIDHLHSKGVVHRDLKPENVLLSADMHVKLTDFGTAKNLAAEETERKKLVEAGKPPRPRANSFVGTAEYVPPEILRPTSDPITTAADLWSLGCVVFQMITGRFPFHGKSDMLTFDRITNRDLRFPKNMPEAARDLIDRLCQVDPTKRIGAGPEGLAELQAHPFFTGIKFDGLWERTPPSMGSFPEPLIFEDEDGVPVSPAAAESVTPPSATPPAMAQVTSPPPQLKGVMSPPLANPKETEAEKFSKFLTPGERILMVGLIDKHQVLRTTKRRHMLLTDTPRLMFITEQLKLKRSIPWELNMSCAVSKSPTHFIFQTGNKRYNMEDASGNAQRWVDAMKEAMRIHKEKGIPQPH